MGIYVRMEFWGDIVIMLIFLRNCPTVLCSSYTILRSHQQYMRVPISLHSQQHLLSSIHPDGCKVESQCGLICISLKANDVEHSFMCLLAIYISSSSEKCLFKFFPYF